MLSAAQWVYLCFKMAVDTEHMYAYPFDHEKTVWVEVSTLA